MSETSLSGILSFWQKAGLYPFTPLEVNFAINLGWVILSSLIRASGDYRLKQKEEEDSQAPFIFLSFKLILFLFSFVAMVAIFLSFSFWLDFYEIQIGHLLWWTPSVASIFLAEFSHLAASLVRKKAEGIATVGEEMVEKSSKELPIYFLSLFFSLGIFWLILILKNRDRFGL